MPNTEAVRVLIADDYFLIREGLKRTLKGMRNIQVVGEIHHSNEIAMKVKQLVPDILLIEINLCEKSVKELVNQVKDLSPQTKILVMSDCACSLPVLASIKAGISGFVRKKVSKAELFEAIYLIIDGNQYFSKDITNILIHSYSKPKPTENSFSERELEILRYICKGRSNDQIGNALYISEKTVATHRRNIMRKAQVNKTSELIIWALDNDIVEN